MKNNINFYQHYANADQHPKFKMLRVQYGWEGEGRFWALNNRIAMAENCILDLSKKYNKSAVASDLNMKTKEFDEFVQYLLIECELIIEHKKGLITTDIIQENYARVSIDRLKARERAGKRWANTNSTTPEKKKSSGEKVCKVKESKVNKELYSRVVGYLNTKTKKNYKASTPKTISLINARLNQGFKEEDFKIVIDGQTKRWLNDIKYNTYLRPETLFGNKFEGYLNDHGGRPKPKKYINIGEI